MKTAMMKLADICPAEYNPRVALKPGDAAYEAMKNSLERFGVAEPLIVNETTGKLVSGHQRLNVLLELGVETVEVVLVKLDAQQEKLLNIALNKIEGDWDYPKLEALFNEISADDIPFTGFTEADLQNLFEFDEKDTKLDFVDDEKDDGTKDDEGRDKNPPEPKKFRIFLSFPTKAQAEKWLEDRNIETQYTGTARNITIRMEGLDYGTGN